MIHAICFTNLDAYKREEWPETFVSVPEIGHYIESESGRLLRVISITHRTKVMQGQNRPSIFIELHN